MNIVKKSFISTVLAASLSLGGAQAQSPSLFLNYGGLNITAPSTVMAAVNPPPASINVRLYTNTGAPYANSSGASSTLFIGGTATSNLGLFLQSGTTYAIEATPETAVPMSGNTIGSTYDVYEKNIAGAVTISQTVWSGTTTPPTYSIDGLGRKCKNGDTTSVLIGSYTAVSATTTENDNNQRIISNIFDKSLKPLYPVDTTTSWTYNSATIRPSNNNTTIGTERVAFLLGDQTSWVYVWNQQLISSTASCWSVIGWGLDTTTAFTCASGMENASGNVLTITVPYMTTGVANFGYHYLQRLEAVPGTATTNTFYGATTVSGLDFLGMNCTGWVYN